MILNCHVPMPSSVSSFLLPSTNPSHSNIKYDKESVILTYDKSKPAHQQLMDTIDLQHNQHHSPIKSHLVQLSLDPCAPTFSPTALVTSTWKDHRFFRIGHLNVNRLRFKIDQVRNLVHNLNLSVLAVTESWLSPDIPDNEVNILGFRIFRRDRPGRRPGGGVCIYVHHSFLVSLAPKYSHPSLEMLWIRIRLKQQDVYVGCLYRPPDEKVKFWSVLDDSLEGLEGEEVVLMGDLNVDVLSSSDTNIVHLKATCTPLQLKNLVHAPTRLSSTSQKCLDVILSNITSLNPAAVEHVDFSDHALVYSKIEQPLPTSEPRTFIVRRLTVDTGPLLHEALDRNNINNFSDQDVNTMWKEWNSKFHAALDAVAPSSVVAQGSRKRRCPWMTPQLLQLIHKQKYFHRRLVRSKVQDVKLFQQHRALRSQATNLYRHLKNTHFQSRLEKYHKCPRQMWSTINYIMGRNNNHLSPAIGLAELADHFKSLLQCTPKAPRVDIPCGPDTLTAMTQFRLVTVSEVQKILRLLNSSKAGGPDHIRPIELKIAASSVAPSVTELINESLATGQLPDDFKTADLIPIFKPGKSDTTIPANYRGISLTCTLSKVLERVVHDQLLQFLNDVEALSDMQFGFRKGRSCSDLLTCIVDDWHHAQDAKRHTAVVFIDLSKAFDNVCHESLLVLLQSYGIGGLALRWIFNYLTNRQQRVVVNSSKSLPFECSKGVPQGSVLGPLLFNMYVADLAELVHDHGASLPSFADDFTLYTSNTSPSVACDSITRALSLVSNLLDARGLTVNKEKTEGMIISPRSYKSDLQGCAIKFQSSAVKLVSKKRLLGVVVDNRLSWSDHVDSVCCKVGRKIGALRRSFRQLPLQTRRTFLLSVIQPDLEYAASATVFNMSNSLRDRLIAMWRRAVRCAARAGCFDSIQPLLKKMFITNIKHRWIQQLATMVRRCHIKVGPSVLVNRLSITSHGYATRGSGSTFRPPISASLSGSISFSNRAPLLWNALPLDVREASSPSSFKSKLLSSLQDTDLYNKIENICFGNPASV